MQVVVKVRAEDATFVRVLASQLTNNGQNAAKLRELLVPPGAPKHVGNPLVALTCNTQGLLSEEEVDALFARDKCVGREVTLDQALWQPRDPSPHPHDLFEAPRSGP